MDRTPVLADRHRIARRLGLPGLMVLALTAAVVPGAAADPIGSLPPALRTGKFVPAGPTLGSELLLNSLAAVVVGGTSLSGGVGGVQRTLIGVLIITLLDNGLNLLGINQYTQMVIKGLVVVAAVLISQDRSKITVMK